MVNPWLIHVKEYRQEHPNLSYKQVLSKAKDTYKPVVKKVKGRGDDLSQTADAISSLSSTNSKLKFADKQIDKGLDFTKDILADETRIRRVKLRQDDRDKRRDLAIARQNELKKAVTERQIARTSRKTSDIKRKEEILDAKHARALKRYE